MRFDHLFPCKKQKCYMTCQDKRFCCLQRLSLVKTTTKTNQIFTGEMKMPQNLILLPVYYGYACDLCLFFNAIVIIHYMIIWWLLKPSIPMRCALSVFHREYSCYWNSTTWYLGLYISLLWISLNWDSTILGLTCTDTLMRENIR